MYVYHMHGKYTILLTNRALHISVLCTLYDISKNSYKYYGALHLYSLHILMEHEATEWRNICSLAKLTLI